MPNSKIKLKTEKALLLHKQGDLLNAANLYREILREDINNTEVLNLLGAALSEVGLHDQAIGFFHKSLVTGGPNSGALYNYGVALKSVGRLVEASRAFKNALEANPEWAECWFNLGQTYRQLNSHRNAIHALKKATELDTGNVLYLIGLGNAYLSAENHKKAVSAYQTSLKIDPNNLESLNNLGVALRKSGKLDHAVDVFNNILEKNPHNAATLNNLGLTLAQLGKAVEAEHSYLSALNNTPDYSEASLNLADLYLQITNFEKAALCINRAISADSQTPLLPVKLATILQKQGRLKEAQKTLTKASGMKGGDKISKLATANVLRDLGEFEAALSLLEPYNKKPIREADGIASLALVHQHRGELETAEELLKHAIQLAPSNWKYHVNLAHARLLNGDYKNGWKEFQWRLKDPAIQKQLASLPGTLWNYSDISNKSVLVTCEQGIGDSFQFIRFVSLLEKRAKDVMLLAPRRLFRILQGHSSRFRVFSSEDDLPSYDIHVPMMSLPLLLELNYVPADIPYLFAEKAVVEEWAIRLSANRLKIGLTWQGNKAYENDYLRSIKFSELLPLIQHKFVDFVLLQKDKSYKTPSADNIINLAPELDNKDGFVDTAAVISSLDLIITVDTASAHLAGALGRPVWVMLNSAPDWRLGPLGRNDSPWYPTMRLFRQTSPGDWQSVIADIYGALENFNRDSSSSKNIKY